MTMDGQAARRQIREKRWQGPTAGLAPGFTQANLVALPERHAFDFFLFCHRNPKPCPLLDVCEPGTHTPSLIAPDADIRTNWSEAGPAVLWTAEVGPGFGGASVVGENVYILDRNDTVGDRLLQAVAHQPVRAHSDGLGHLVRGQVIRHLILPLRRRAFDATEVAGCPRG